MTVLVLVITKGGLLENHPANALQSFEVVNPLSLGFALHNSGLIASTRMKVVRMSWTRNEISWHGQFRMKSLISVILDSGLLHLRRSGQVTYQ